MRHIFFLLVFIIAHLSSQATLTHPLHPRTKITIIGAGLAGLTAAYRLQKLGYICEVYEARMRPGGRVFTAYFGSTYDELGGKNVYDGGNGEHILSLIDELGLHTQTHHLHNSTYSLFHTQSLKNIDLFKKLPEPTEELLSSLKTKISMAHSLADILDDLFLDSPLRQRMEIMMRGWEGSATCDLASEYVYDSFWKMYQFLNKMLYSTPEKPLHIEHRSVVGGNSQLIAALAHLLEGHIHYGMPLRRITRSTDQKIQLHFDTGCMWTDYLILTIPCTTLRDVDIEDGIFPADQLCAIRTLQYGTNAKILLPVQCYTAFPTKWATSEHASTFLNKDNSVMTWISGGILGVFDVHDGRSAFSIMEKEMPFLIEAFPNLKFTHGFNPTPPKETLFSQYDTPVAISWIHEEFSKGSYSNYGVGTFVFFNEFIDEYQESVRKAFRSIDGRIFFAGEHTAPQGDNGTMDGAVNSGERAARMLQRAITVF